MPQVIESMKRIQFHNYIVRVWRSEQVLMDDYDNSDLDALAEQLRHEHAHGPVGKHVLAMIFGNMPRVSAVEVTGKLDGNGPLLYTDWP